MGYNFQKRRNFHLNYILLSISMLSVVLQNGLFNTVSKNKLKNKFDTFRYNSWLYLICFVLFALLSLGSKFSLFSVLLGLIFGIITMLSNFCKITALGKGPMHITILVTTSSMIIPAMSGAIMFGERFSIGKALAILLLIFFITSADSGTYVLSMISSNGAMNPPISKKMV